MNLQKFETEKIEKLNKIVGGDGSVDTTNSTSVLDETGTDPTDAVKSRTKSNNTNE